MEKIKEGLKKALFKQFGKRIDNGKCVFCGESLNPGSFCNCTNSKKINRYFQKANNFINKFNCCLNSEDLKSYKQTLNTRAAIPAKYQGLEFEDYISKSPKQDEIFNTVKKYYDDCFKNFLIGKNLILTGNFGTTKTLLMSILTHCLTLNYGFNVRYINSVDLINEIKDSFNTSTKITTKEVLERYCKSDFMFIDDIDKLNPTDYARELVYSIVNIRYEKELPIVISFNSSIEELDEKYFGEAVVSRLLEKSTYIQFDLEDMRF